MRSLLPRNGWRLSALALVLSLLTGSAYLFVYRTSEAFPGMPAEQRAYWEWVGSIGREGALENGFSLLESHPELRPLYVRLSSLCLELEAAGECRGRLKRVHPADPLYRDASLAMLDDDEAWIAVASSPTLDPPVARLVVDALRDENELLIQVTDQWARSLGADSTRAGAAFGLGYVAVLDSDWDVAAPLLRHVRIAPKDPHAFRELGRMYFFKGDFSGFERALTAGLEKARRAHDVEQELILRGNLGLGYLQWSGDLEKAGSMFETALIQSRLLAMGEAEGFNAYRLANVRGRQHRYNDAMALLDSAESRYRSHIPHRISEILVLRGMLLKNMYRYSEAAQKLDDALRAADENEDLPGRVQALIALSEVEGRTGALASARRHGHAALSLASEYEMTDYAVAARSVLGDLALAQGRLEEARENYLAGLELARETGNTAREREMREQLGLTALHIGDLNQAHKYFLELRDLVAGVPFDLARSLYWIGSSYSEFGNYEEALRYLEEAQPADGPLATSVQQARASALLHLGRLDESRALLESALKSAENDRVSELEVFLGHVLIRQGRYADALEHLERSAVGGATQFSSGWFAAYGKALAYWGMKQRAEAERQFLEAVATIEAQRDDLSHPEDRAYFIGDKVAVFDSFTLFLEEDQRTVEAFDVKERVRSRTLTDLLFTSSAGRDFKSRSARIRALEHEIHQEDLGLEDRADTYRSNRTRFLRAERDTAYRERAMLGSNLVQTFQPVDARSVQRMLAPGDALVSFNLRTHGEGPSSEPSSAAYVVLKNLVVRIPLPADAAEVTEAVRFLRSAISSREEFAPAARRLYDDLFAPIRSALPPSTKHLHIVPDGILHYLPFSVLLDEHGKYLIEGFTFSTVPSATALKLSRDVNPGGWESMLLLADPDSRLPGARREVLEIAARETTRRHVLVGEEASRQRLTAMAAGYDILHFATHGTFVSREPWNSHLELHDDLLTVDEIGRLELNAYLVTLSACETALSGGLATDVPEGDEWVGLNQAFLAAGTPTVMASLWPIDDLASSRFMVGFYDRLGPDGKAAALAGMQRAFLSESKTAHPFYWAAFTVIGDPN